jgi:hypothetical protein
MGRHNQLTERYQRLSDKKKTLEGQAARNAEAELQTVIDEARGLENQYNFPEPTRLQERLESTNKPIVLEPLIIIGDPEGEPEPEELPREERLISRSPMGRTNASRYKKMYKS